MLISAIIKMPNYEFRCETCDGTREVFYSLSEKILNPICCTRAMGRIWGTVPVVFKGSGFYKTDNR